MAKKAKVQAQPVLSRPVTFEERIEGVAEWIIFKLNGYVKESQAARERIAENFLKSNYEAAYAVEWMDNKVRLFYMGSFAEEMLKELESKETVRAKLETIRAIAENIKVNRLDYWSPKSSTSAYTNECNNEMFHACKEFLQWTGYKIIEEYMKDPQWVSGQTPKAEEGALETAE